MRQISSRFTVHQLADQEIVEGSKLTGLQTQCIQNQIAAIAENKIDLAFDVESPNSFIQQEAYLRGQLDALSYLLELSTTAINSTEGN